jgi:hypothetical protein
VNARDHAETAERLLATSAGWESPAGTTPQLLRCLVHAVLALALAGDGSLDPGTGAEVLPFPLPTNDLPDV